VSALAEASVRLLGEKLKSKTRRVRQSDGGSRAGSFSCRMGEGQFEGLSGKWGTAGAVFCASSEASKPAPSVMPRRVSRRWSISRPRSSRPLTLPADQLSNPAASSRVLPSR
jgi:hypothetical protein